MEQQQPSIMLNQGAHPVRQTAGLGGNQGKPVSAKHKRRSTAARQAPPFAAMLAAMPMGVLFVDRQGDAAYCNPAFERMWQPLAENPTPASSHSEGLSPLSRRTLSRLAKAGLPMFDRARSPTANEPPFPIEIGTGDGRFLRCTGQSMHDGGKLRGWLWLFEDVTQAQQLTARLYYRAEHDALTGLYNRYRFEEELSRQLAAGERNHQRVALLLLDLDGFKDVNDTYGHQVGDELLVRVADAVSAEVRRNEFLARLGGDEFAILATNASDQEVASLAERIMGAIARVGPSILPQSRVPTGSLGAAIFPVHATTADALLARADATMYRAKAAGKATWRIWGDDR